MTISSAECASSSSRSSTSSDHSRGGGAAIRLNTSPVSLHPRDTKVAAVPSAPEPATPPTSVVRRPAQTSGGEHGADGRAASPHDEYPAAHAASPRMASTEAERRQHTKDWLFGSLPAQDEATRLQQRLADQVQDALRSLRERRDIGALQQARVSVLRVQFSQHLEPELAAEVLFDTVNGILDVFDAAGGCVAEQALQFATRLLDDACRRGDRLSWQQRHQVRGRLLVMAPHDGAQRRLLTGLRAHSALLVAPDEPDDWPNHAVKLAGSMFEAPFDEAFSVHWNDVCMALPSLDATRQRELVGELGDLLRSHADEEQLQAPVMASALSLIGAAAKMDAPCRALVRQACADVVGKAGLASRAARQVLALAMHLEAADGAGAGHGNRQVLEDDSRAMRVLLEHACKHIAEEAPASLEILFPYCLDAMKSLLPRDAASIASHTRQVAARGGDLDLQVAFARLTAKALARLVDERELFIDEAGKLIGVLDQHLAPTFHVARHNASQHPIATLFDELFKLGEGAWFAPTAQRLTDLRNKLLPRLQPRPA